MPFDLTIKSVIQRVIGFKGKSKSILIKIIKCDKSGVRLSQVRLVLDHNYLQASKSNTLETTRTIPSFGQRWNRKVKHDGLSILSEHWEVISSYLHVFNNIDNFSSGIRISKLALIGHGTQLRKGLNQLAQRRVRKTRSKMTQQFQLRLEFRILNGQHTE